MRILMILLIFLLVILQYKLWFQQGGIVDSIRLNHAVFKQEKANEGDYKRNQKLIAKIYRLKHGKHIVADLARKNIGMVKRGERFYQFVPTNDQKSETANENNHQ